MLHVGHINSGPVIIERLRVDRSRLKNTSGAQESSHVHPPTQRGDSQACDQKTANPKYSDAHLEPLLYSCTRSTRATCRGYDGWNSIWGQTRTTGARRCRRRCFTTCCNVDYGITSTFSRTKTHVADRNCCGIHNFTIARPACTRYSNNAALEICSRKRTGLIFHKAVCRSSIQSHPRSWSRRPCRRSALHNNSGVTLSVESHAHTKATFGNTPRRSRRGANDKRLS